jgi:drug/metabolite transporter (DMT)-like permease
MTCPQIRLQMNRLTGWCWLRRADLGSAFFFIGVAVRRAAADLCGCLRPTIAAAGMWLYVMVKGATSAFRARSGADAGAGAAQQCDPFALFGWGQTHTASGPASILNATTPIWVVAAHFLTHDERMSPQDAAIWASAAWP